LNFKVWKMKNLEKNQKSGRARLPAAHDGPWPRVPPCARPRARGDTAVARSPPATSRRRCQPRHLPPGLHTQHMQPPPVYTTLCLILALLWSEAEANFFPLPHSSRCALATTLYLSPASAPSTEHRRWEPPLPPRVPTCRRRLGSARAKPTTARSRPDNT
jgi:hypothetical protein